MLKVDEHALSDHDFNNSQIANYYKGFTFSEQFTWRTKFDGLTFESIKCYLVREAI